MATKQSSRKNWKKVRRAGKWVTIDTRTGKVVTRRDRAAVKDAQRQERRDQDKRQRQAIGDRLVYSDETDHKGRPLTIHQAKQNAKKDEGYGAHVRGQQKKDSTKTTKSKKTTKTKKTKDIKINKTETPKAKSTKANEWGPGGQPKASEQMKIYKASEASAADKKWLEDTKNSPAAKAFGKGPKANALRLQARKNYLKFKKTHNRK